MKKLLKILAIIIAVSMLAACSMPSWLTYTNAAHQFQFKYPPGSTLVTDTPTSARIQLPIAEKTTLVEKYLDVNATYGIPCLSPYSNGYLPPGSLVTGTQIINGNSWVIEEASEGAAGSIYQWTAYSSVIIGEAFCVSLTFVLHSLATPLPEFDKDGESLVFQMILSTFTVLTPTLPAPLIPVITNTPTLVFTYTPTLVVSDTPTLVITDTPTPVPFYYFIPRFNAYCRFGPDPIFGWDELAMEGQSYLIDGRNLEGTWLRIMLTPQTGCWVPLEDGTPSADIWQVRVLAVIPTPTATPVPFDCGKYNDPNACGMYPSMCTWNPRIPPNGVCQNK